VTVQPSRWWMVRTHGETGGATVKVLIKRD
jgi:hypothetical protein